MATYLWSTLTNGSTIAFNAAVDVLQFNDSSILATERDLLLWTGNNVVFKVEGKSNAALNKTVNFTISGGGRALTDTNVTFASGSKILVGDNTLNVGNGTSTFDDAANNLTGSSGADLLIGLAGNDTYAGGDGNDTFAVANGSQAFGSDIVDGGAGLGDAIGIGSHPSVNFGATISFTTHQLNTVQGSASFANIEFAFGTAFADVITGIDNSRVLTGLGASNGNFDYSLGMRGYAGNDTFIGDNRDGYIEYVTYTDAPSGVVANLATGTATDGYDSDTATAGVQPYTDTLTNIDALQGSAFDDVLIGGGPGTTFNGLRFENLEGRGGNDTLNANGATNVRADYINSPSGVTVNLATGTASDGWGGTDTLIGIAGLRGSTSNDSLTGDSKNNYLEGREGNDFLDGGEGVDSIFYQSATSAINIDLALGTSSSTGGNGTDTWVNIEGIRGGDYNDTLRGTDGVDNVLEGLAGSDLLDGRTGSDLVRYDRSPNAVIVNLATNIALDGYDVDPVTAGIQHSTDTLVSIERVRGSKFNDVLTGNAGDNRFEGWLGNDTIDGAEGNDTALFRGAYAQYVIAPTSTGWKVTGSDGADTLTNIEFLQFDDKTLPLVSGSGSIQGTSGDEVIAGSDGDDTIVGNGGDDTLIGNGGADTLIGGPGNNTYSIDDLDTIVEEENGGTDTVISPGSYTLRQNLENLILGGTGSFDATGNGLNNVLTGNAGDNVLDGQAGSDTAGYTGATSGVTVNLGVADPQAVGGGQGSDTLRGIESLIGSSYDDTLTGTGGANSLDGGTGADRMVGGGGADTYTVNDVGDAVVESDNTPTGLRLDLDLATTIDTVISSISYSLGAFVENLTLASGTDDLNATGNSLANLITGNAGANRLEGGLGNDLIRGGDGSDTAAFSGSMSSYVFGARASGGVTVVSGPDGSDALIGVEYVSFGGGESVAVTSLGPLKQVVSVTRDGATSYHIATPFSRPPIAGIQIDYEFLGESSGEVSIGTDANDFFNLLGGDDAAAGSAGNDIIDGGTGSNFLNGDAGTDTFFLDGRGGTVTWSTITDWQAGEQLSVWGWKADSKVVVWRQDGAAGFQGITMHADLNNDGTIDTSVTWTGKTQAELPTPGQFAAQELLWFT